ncbi:hypothetical protein FHETE_5584 [Fusarium heterosporum]|uniref:ABM domain-containing protein n=1 Tax=Fusarium heterosporum TaxID=42747 RepID=A0A8H5TEJ5_FUSHE|nr:hypothetical protein FHETE_5584 [Fusarium heterosporum]
MTVTEVGCMVVKPGLDIMNDSTPEGQILTGTWNTVLSKPGGPQRVFWGLESVDASKVWGFFDFESIEQHQRYGADAVKDIPKICTRGEFTKHVKMFPSSNVLGSTMTEVMLVYFPQDISPEHQKSLELQLKEILTQNFECDPGVTEVAYGWGVEKDFPAREEDGQPRAVLMGFVGWDTVDAHKGVSEHKNYKETIAMIAGLKGSTSFYSFTLSCRHLERS